MVSDVVISVTGLGYVGLPLAVAFAGKYRVIGFDFDKKRIRELKSGYDHTNELSADELRNAHRLEFVEDENVLSEANIHFIIVPTPVDDAHNPDISTLLAATRTIGKKLKKNDAVIYESSVYPGNTEDDCIPILEKESGLKLNADFWVGYSPERINPGDRAHRFHNTNKIVSASSDKELSTIAELYASVINAEIHLAPNIKVAELAKLIENTQRDINIALMNELAHICHRLSIDTGDVLEAARTKWNFIHFTPGLVGGHCIGVDPYYLTHRALRSGYYSDVILAGRRINDEMGIYIAHQTIEYFDKNHITDPTITILGIAFKENVPDIRNTRVYEIIRELQAHGFKVQISDPLAQPNDVITQYNIKLTALNDLERSDGVILAVAHDAYAKGSWTMIESLLKNGRGYVADVKCILDRNSKPDGIALWRL
jgi:UDP-N-acetyl-D-galactosamine dehydrogenase